MYSIGGNVLYYYCDLARYLGPDQPFFALQQQGLDGRGALHTRIEDMASHYVKEIRTFLPQGPYLLGGHSLGGLIAYEAALQLSAQGQNVALLALIDTFFPCDRNGSAAVQRVPGATSLLEKVRFHLDNLMELRARYGLAYAVERVESVGERLSRTLTHALSPRHVFTRVGSPHDGGPLLPEAYYPLLHEIENNKPPGRDRLRPAWLGRPGYHLPQ